MKQIQLFIRKNRRKMHTNKKGGIEGLPLQLLIIIVVASLGLAVMVGWFNNIDEPDMIDSIETSYDRSGNDTYSITVRVLDKDGYAVEGADVVLTGYGAYALSGNSYSTVSDTLVIASNVYYDGHYYGEPTPLPKEGLIEAGYDVSRFAPVVSETHFEGGRVTPHGVTDSEGYATIDVHFDSLKTYGTLNIEVTKAGYTGSNTTMKVFA